MLKIGILVSGGGTNLQAVIDAIEKGFLKECVISIVVSSQNNVPALERCKKHKIPHAVIAKKGKNVEEYDRAIISILEQNNVELVVLAGFMYILGRVFVERYKNKIINVHPSLIPAFCGKGFYGLVPHQKALEYGVKITGATVHFVELDTDAGPVILQKAVEVNDDDTPATLQKRVMEHAEWIILPEAIRLYSEKRLVIDDRRVRIKSKL